LPGHKEIKEKGGPLAGGKMEGKRPPKGFNLKEKPQKLKVKGR